MVNWESVLAAALGAVFGGVSTGVIVHMSLQRTITIVSTRVEEMAKLCAECRVAMNEHRDHHQDLVKGAVTDQYAQHEARITRCEDRLLARAMK